MPAPTVQPSLVVESVMTEGAKKSGPTHGKIIAALASLKARANPSRSDRASRRTLRKLAFAVFNPDRTRPSTALDGTELDAPFRRSLFLRNRFLARIKVTTRWQDAEHKHDLEAFCGGPGLAWRWGVSA